MGNVVVSYVYDAWGKVYSVTGSMADTLGQINPIRYRSYYYDNETGFYYLNSRYYDPDVKRFINEDGLIDTRGIITQNLYSYAGNNPIMFIDSNGQCITAYLKGYKGSCPGINSPDCYDNYSPADLPYAGNLKTDKNDAVSLIDPKSPPDHPEYKPPKKGPKRVKNPNGKGNGWQAKDGGVWIWTPKMHGDPGWTIQYPGGGHSHAYPGGGVRKAEKQSEPVKGVIIIFAASLATAYLVTNDATGIGVADDVFIPSTVGCIFAGMDMLGGKYVCECGESWYGF